MSLSIQRISLQQVAEIGISGHTWTPAIYGTCLAFHSDPLQELATQAGQSVQVWLQQRVIAGLWEDHPKQSALAFYVPGQILRLFICMKRDKYLKKVFEAVGTCPAYIESGHDCFPLKYGRSIRPLVYWEPPCTMVALWPRGAEGEVWEEPAVVDTGNLMHYFSYPEADHEQSVPVDVAGLEYVRVPQREDESFRWEGTEYRVVHRFYVLAE